MRFSSVLRKKLILEKGEFRDLFARYLDDRLSPDEISVLFDLLKEKDEEEIQQLLRSLIANLQGQDFSGNSDLEPVYDRVYRRIQSATHSSTSPESSDFRAKGNLQGTGEADGKIKTLPPAKKYWRHIAASVALLVLLGAGSFFLFFKINSTQVQSTQVMPVAKRILPGGNKAVLTLADGSQVLLDQAETGELAEQGNIKIRKTSDGTIVYEALPAKKEEGSRIAYNTIRTPMGGQYQVVLPDGTKAWLNAGSRLRYPTAFRREERKVELAGEAYFEVAHDKTRPFIVSTLDQEIQVLGTHFNVKAYADEPGTNTTLLKGAVKIIAGNHVQLLHPGQQAQVVSGKDQIKVVQNVNTAAAIAWKNGKFVFEGERIESIMKRVARWYNVEIVYQGAVTDNEFIGTISRFKDISEVLNLLELTGTVHFKVEANASKPTERRVIVMP